MAFSFKEVKLKFVIAMGNGSIFPSVTSISKGAADIEEKIKKYKYSAIIFFIFTLLLLV